MEVDPYPKVLVTLSTFEFWERFAFMKYVEVGVGLVVSVSCFVFPIG